MNRQELLDLDITTYNLAIELQCKKDGINVKFSICEHCGRKHIICCICDRARDAWKSMLDEIKLVNDYHNSKNEMNCEGEMNCEHKFIYGGVKYEIDHYPMSGTAAKCVRYCDWFYCEKCLEKRYEWKSEYSTTYERILFNATPK